jgi:ectoine hydroxylase-related dioxygenase (phytanoyl-CoA dioxygenase family)
MLAPDVIASHVERIERDGFTILEGVIEPDLVDEIAADLERLERVTNEGVGKNIFEGFHTVRLYNLLAHGKVYERVPVHENVLPIVTGVLDSGCLVSSLSSVAIGAEEAPQPLHADDMIIGLPRPHQPLVCNTMWAITDFTEENGATRIIPGSHRREDTPILGTHYESAAAVMKRGSVMVFNGSIWHGGGANKTSARRVGIAMNYCAGWIRQQENQQLGIPREIAKGFSPRLRKLVGYGIYRGLIGHIDKCSPVDLLDESGPRRVVGE